jgi:hypothetical protein
LLLVFYMTKKSACNALSSIHVGSQNSGAHTIVRSRVPSALSSVALAVALAAGCGVEGGNDLQLSESSSAVTVKDAERGSGCSTMVVLGLSKQIAAEIACASPSLLARFDATANIKFNSAAVLPYFAPEAITALTDAAAGTTIRINSGFRSVAQQHLLYKWRARGKCGLTDVATPGRSNHESARALDVANWGAMETRMENNGWNHYLPNDLVHFEYPDSQDIRGEDVAAFQRLWNRNHPDDVISDDGEYGPETADRLSQSPGAGFAMGAACAGTSADPLPLASELVDDAANDEQSTELAGGCNAAQPAGGGTFALSLMMLIAAIRRRSR